MDKAEPRRETCKAVSPAPAGTGALQAGVMVGVDVGKAVGVGVAPKAIR